VFRCIYKPLSRAENTQYRIIAREQLVYPAHFRIQLYSLQVAGSELLSKENFMYSIHCGVQYIGFRVRVVPPEHVIYRIYCIVVQSTQVAG
jgi:hypothetical protein